MFTKNSNLGKSFSPIGKSSNSKSSGRKFVNNKAVYILDVYIGWKEGAPVTVALNGDTYDHRALIERCGAVFYLTRDASESKLKLVRIFVYIHSSKKFNI